MPDETDKKKPPAPQRVVFGREQTPDQMADAMIVFLNEERRKMGLPPMPK